MRRGQAFGVRQASGALASPRAASVQSYGARSQSARGLAHSKTLTRHRTLHGLALRRGAVSECTRDRQTTAALALVAGGGVQTMHKSPLQSGAAKSPQPHGVG